MAARPASTLAVGMAAALGADEVPVLDAEELEPAVELELVGAAVVDAAELLDAEDLELWE